MTVIELVPPTVALVAIVRKRFPGVNGPWRTLAVLAVFAALELFTEGAFHLSDPVGGARLVAKLVLTAFAAVFLADRVAGVDTYASDDPPEQDGGKAPPTCPACSPSDATPVPVAASSAPGTGA